MAKDTFTKKEMIEIINRNKELKEENKALIEQGKKIIPIRNSK